MGVNYGSGLTKGGVFSCAGIITLVRKERRGRGARNDVGCLGVFYSLLILFGGGVVVGDAPAGGGFSEDEGEEAGGVVGGSLEVEAAKDEGGVGREDGDVDVGES